MLLSQHLCPSGRLSWNAPPWQVPGQFPHLLQVSTQMSAPMKPSRMTLLMLIEYLPSQNYLTAFTMLPHHPQLLSPSSILHYLFIYVCIICLTLQNVSSTRAGQHLVCLLVCSQCPKLWQNTFPKVGCNNNPLSQLLFCSVTLTFLHQETEALAPESGLALVTCSINGLLQKLCFGPLQLGHGSLGKLALEMLPLRVQLPHHEKTKPHGHVWVLRSPAQLSSQPTAGIITSQITVPFWCPVQQNLQLTPDSTT